MRPSVSDLLKEPWLQSSTLTPEEVRQELSLRKQKILKEKEAEKERAKRKKAAGQYGRGGKDFDPDKVKHRDVATGGEVVELAVEEAPAPTASKDIMDNITNLYTAEGPATATRRAKEALELMGAKVTSKGDYHIRAMVPVDQSAVELDVKILSIPDDKIQVLSVSRKQGDPLSFQKAFRTFKNHTADLHGEEEDVASPALTKVPGPEPLDADEVEVEVAEQALDNDVGMI